VRRRGVDMVACRRRGEKRRSATFRGNDMRLEGKEIVVTGGTDGIGKIAAGAFVRMGANVTIVGRNAAKAESVAGELRKSAQDGRVDFVTGDLSTQKGVRSAAAALKQRLKRIDVLLNNAGAFFQRRELSEDGVERTFALNHLGYFLMTAELLSLVKAAERARIVNVASAAHFGAKLDFADLQNAKAYSGWRAYQQSKLANIYFTYELARRLKGAAITVNCLHPGFVATRFGNENTGLFRFFFGLAKSLLAKSEEEGAKTSIFLASSPEVDGVSGKYFDDCKDVRSSPASYDEEAARELWRVSERLVGASPA
jgi:NAD(P)-dependent dehydrogenase (short-subunit alcohol dehydrogenase family)